MDLTSISAAIGSAKAIVDLLKNATDAQLALKVSSEVSKLQGQLIDVQQQVLATQSDNIRLAEENLQLKTTLAAERDAPKCPKCRKPGWRIVKTEDDPTFGRLGVQRRTYSCESRGFEEYKQIQ